MKGTSKCFVPKGYERFLETFVVPPVHISAERRQTRGKRAAPSSCALKPELLRAPGCLKLLLRFWQVCS